MLIYLKRKAYREDSINQINCIHLCLNLNDSTHIGLEKIIGLPINDCFKQYTSSKTFNFLSNRSPAYINDIPKPTGYPNNNTRMSFLGVSQPLQNTNYG